MEPQNDLQKKALSLIQTRIALPKFQRSGAVNTTALAADVAEDLGVEDLLDDPNCWLWRMVNSESRKLYEPPAEPATG